MITRTINTFTGGIAEDLREPSTTSFSTCKGFDSTTFSPFGGAGLGSSSIDSTTSQNLIVTAQMDTALTNATSAVRNYFVMKLV